MAHIKVKVELNSFRVVESNESLDNPYIWPIYIVLDGTILNQPKDSAVLPMVAPRTGHGNIQHLNNTVTDAISFHFETDLQPGALAINPSLWQAGCMVVPAVVFLEEDSSTDSDALAAHDAMMAELQKQGNDALRQALATLQFPDNFALDQNALTNAILSKMVLKKLDDQATWGAIPFADFIYTIINAISAANPDDFVGAGLGDRHHVGELVGNPQGFDFDVESGDNQGNGVYMVSGRIRRSDTDEPPVMAVTRVGTNLRVYARTVEDRYDVFESGDLGVPFHDQGLMNQGIFLSGPAAWASPNGWHQHVVGLGLDNHFYLASHHGGHGFSDPRQLGDGVFKSAAAVCGTSDGKWVHIVGRGTDDRYWHGFSNDGGANVQGWWPIGEGKFASTPAAVITPDGSRLMVFGLGQDNHIWWAFSHDHGTSWDMAWDILPRLSQPNVWYETNIMTSAPAAAISGDGKTVVVVGRAHDHSFWMTSSGDGGQSFGGYWNPLGVGVFDSAPAVAAGQTGIDVIVAGLGNDLFPWTCHTTGQDAAWSRVLPVAGFGMMYY